MSNKILDDNDNDNQDFADASDHVVDADDVADNNAGDDIVFVEPVREIARRRPTANLPARLMDLSPEAQEIRKLDEEMRRWESEGNAALTEAGIKDVLAQAHLRWWTREDGSPAGETGACPAAFASEDGGLA